MSDSYWNYEDDENIVCPYCGKEYEQLDIFSIMKTPYKITNKIRLIELFAGVGSQAMALKRLAADFEHYKVVEFDKYAIKS